MTSAGERSERGHGPGDQVGGWILERRVASGTEASNYAVRRASTGQRGFLKSLPKALADVARGRFSREFSALSSLPAGARVPQILERDEDREFGPYLVVEWIDGKNLAEVLAERQSLQREEAFAVTRAIAQTLSLVHQHGFLHRDIKPSNVMIPLDGVALAFDRAVLLDFGLAGILHAVRDEDMRKTMAGGIIGTPLYMSPEQARGRGLGPASDVWATGVTLHEMLTGELPFSGENLHDLIYRIAVEPYRPVDGLDERLVAFFMRCFQKTESLRIRDGAELLDALEDAFAPQTTGGNATPMAGLPLAPSSAWNADDAPTSARHPTFISLPSFPPPLASASARRPFRLLEHPSTLDAMACTVVASIAAAVGTVLDARHETAVVDLVIAGSLVAIGLAGGGLWREWSLDRRLQPSRPLAALRQRIETLRDEERGLSRSVAIDLDDLIRVLELNAVNGWHASQALRLYEPYRDARDRGHDDAAIVHAGPLIQYVEGQLPWVVRNAALIGDAVRWGALALAGAALLRAGWVALSG